MKKVILLNCRKILFLKSANSKMSLKKRKDKRYYYSVESEPFIYEAHCYLGIILENGEKVQKDIKVFYH